MPVIFVLNGANLNMLGIREPEIYGTRTLDDVRSLVAKHAKTRGVTINFRQSNHEGDLIDWIHEAHSAADGVILNPGGFTRTSVSILDAVKAISKPVIELHLSNTAKRESYRGPSMISHGVNAVIAGFGAYGYVLAMDGLVDLIGDRRPDVEPAKVRKAAVKRRKT